MLTNGVQIAETTEAEGGVDEAHKRSEKVGSVDSVLRHV